MRDGKFYHSTIHQGVFFIYLLPSIRWRSISYLICRDGKSYSSGNHRGNFSFLIHRVGKSYSSGNHWGNFSCLIRRDGKSYVSTNQTRNISFAIDLQSLPTSPPFNLRHQFRLGYGGGTGICGAVFNSSRITSMALSS